MTMVHSTIYPGIMLQPYLLSCLFLVLFYLRDRTRAGIIICNISGISFSVCVLHGLNGYYMLGLLDYRGIHPYLALIITALLFTGLSDFFIAL